MTLRVLLVHNYYRQNAGEDASFAAEEKYLVEDPEVEVFSYIRDSADIDTYGLRDKSRLALETVWSRRSRGGIDRLIDEVRPDVVHAHNTFPLVSPSVLSACAGKGIPLVHTVRNFRMFCAKAIFFRDGHICEDCVGRTPPWPGVVHACYRGSRMQSAVVVSMQALNASRGTWREPTAYIVPTAFVRDKLARLGFNRETIVVKPDIVIPDPGPIGKKEDFALFVGRFTEGKGIPTLVRAWSHLPHIPLKLVGSGPGELEIRNLVEAHGLVGAVDFVGEMSRSRVLELMQRAKFVIMPSESYETFGRIAVESFACGTPVIASRIEALTETIQEGKTGLHFSPGQADDLARKIKWMSDHPAETEKMARRARLEYESTYSADKLHESLVSIYRALMAGVPLAAE
ncbi:MAG: glycosyltransferase family 4 protein [Actinomycetota bacterium]|nr:glycosyltransferase family 4 protein [Actinomycetota bacterium]